MCCQPTSALSQEAKKEGMSYIGNNDNMEQPSVFRQVEKFIRECGHPKVFVHVSSPCARGSPLRYLRGLKPTDADFEWFAMFPWVWRWVMIPVLNCHGTLFGNTICLLRHCGRVNMTITPCCTCVRQALRRRTCSRLERFWGLFPIQSSL